MKKVIWGLGALLVLTIAVATACHTVHGMGQDIKSGGQHIENAAS